MQFMTSLPVRGAWIEIGAGVGVSAAGASLPVRGAWIEMVRIAGQRQLVQGRSPCEERGLKLPLRCG